MHEPNLLDAVDDVFLDAWNKSNAGLALAVLGEASKPTLASRLELQERTIIALHECVRLLAAELDDREAN